MSRSLSVVIPVAVAAAWLCTASPAAAQKIEATTAFQRGQQLKREGKIAEACSAFELSMRLDAQFGTQYNLALCYLDLGRTASAWAELRELSIKDSNQARRADATRRILELRPRLTSVTVKIAKPTPQLVVTRNTIDVTAIAGAPTPVDPGTHRFLATAPGHRAWSAEIKVAGEGKVIDVAIPPLEPDAGAPASDSQPPAAAALPPVPEGAEQQPGRARRIAGIAVFSTGLASATVGAVYGIRALSRGNKARDECGGELAQCMGDVAVAERLVEDGRSFARISNIALIAGGVVAATGIVLYVTAPNGVTAAPVAGPGAVGFGVSGRF